MSITAYTQGALVLKLGIHQVDNLVHILPLCTQKGILGYLICPG